MKTFREFLKIVFALNVPFNVQECYDKNLSVNESKRVLSIKNSKLEGVRNTLLLFIWQKFSSLSSILKMSDN